MDIVNDSSVFITSDTALAAWLYTSGIIYIEITDGFPTSFVFPRNNGNKLDELITKFQSGEAYGNILAYIRNYHVLTQKTKRGGR